MSNSLDPEQSRHFVGHDLDPNALQSLSSDDTRSDCHGAALWATSLLFVLTISCVNVYQTQTKIQLANLKQKHSVLSCNQTSQLAQKIKLIYKTRKRFNLELSPRRLVCVILIRNKWIFHKSHAFVGLNNCFDAMSQ